MSNTATDWVEQFDQTWDFTQWLSDHATIYAKPELKDTYDNTYNGYVSPGARPDFLVDFHNNGPLAACFVEDAEDIASFSRNLSVSGCLCEYALDPEHAHITTDVEEDLHPELALVATQFSPFGRLLTDKLPVTNPSTNSLRDDLKDDSDFATHLLAQTLHSNITHQASQNDTDPLPYGVLVGDPDHGQTFKPPAALYYDTTSYHAQEPSWKTLSVV